MGYHTTNAAFAFDMQPDYATEPAWAPEAPAAAPAPQLDVLTGRGREANQAVSPLFTHCIKVFCVLAVLFFAIGLVRVAIASATATSLNANAALANKLEAEQKESADLEVMHSVYGSSTRIRDLASGYGMTAPEGNVTLDFAAQAPAASSAQR